MGERCVCSLAFSLFFLPFDGNEEEEEGFPAAGGRGG